MHLFSIHWYPIGTLITRPTSPPPVKTTGLGGATTGIKQADFMSDLKEKSSGPTAIKNTDILAGNTGKPAINKQSAVMQLQVDEEKARRKMLGFPSSDEDKKKKKKKTKKP